MRSTFKFKVPYSSPDIISIDTGLTGILRYSPKWKTPVAEAKIVLTGYRRKDYIEAEKISKNKHEPGKTVWHHVWEKDDNGLYTIQLVEFENHKKTCPHAGGCKMWTLATGATVYRNVNVYIGKNLMDLSTSLGYSFTKDAFEFCKTTQPYSDLVIDYIFTENAVEQDCIILSEEQSKLVYSIKHTNRALKAQRKNLKACLRKYGIDPYGNIFYLDKINDIYFYDHERGSLVVTGINLKELTSVNNSQ